MATTLTISAAKAARLLRRFAQELPQRVKEAENESLADALAEAVKASSGPYSSEELGRMGHPYAKRHKNAALNPEIVNVQSGDFQRAWRKTSAHRNGWLIQGRVVNADKSARFMRGTKLMVARPIARRVLRRIAGRRKMRLRRAVHIAWQAALNA